MNWGHGELRDGAPMDQLLITAAEVMKRRGQALTADLEALYVTVREETAWERRDALRAGEKQWRKSA